MKRTLVVTENGRSRELLFIGTMAVGRDPQCDISGSDPLLSRRHAEFVVQGERVFVRDLQSRNGITINGRKVEEATLRAGDRVQVANLRIEYVEDLEGAALTEDSATLRLARGGGALDGAGAPHLAPDAAGAAIIAVSHDRAAAADEVAAPAAAPREVRPPAPALPETAVPSPPASLARPAPAPTPTAPAPAPALPTSAPAPLATDQSLRLRTHSQVARAATAAVAAARPAAWVRRVRVIVVALAVTVFAVTAVPMAAPHPAMHVVELLFAGAFTVVAALIAAALIERTAADAIDALPPTAPPAAGSNVPGPSELPLQQNARSSS